MEHIVQFGISFDDEVIVGRIKNKAEKTITDKLFAEIKGQLFAKYSDKPSYFVEAKIDLFLENNRDQIIETAANYLAERLTRTKKGKEILNKYDKD